MCTIIKFPIMQVGTIKMIFFTDGGHYVKVSKLCACASLRNGVGVAFGHVTISSGIPLALAIFALV